MIVMLNGFLLLLALSQSPDGKLPAELRVNPARIELEGALASYSLQVEGTLPDGHVVDWTHQARYASTNPNVASVTSHGVVLARGDGEAIIRIEVKSRTVEIPVHIKGTTQPRHLTYQHDILPIFSRHGCNSSGCHGKAEGQNGFKLSVFGFDPQADFLALVQEDRGRRILPTSPEASLLVRKMSGLMPHGGGSRIPRDSSDYATVVAWIANGAPPNDLTEAVVQKVRIEPAERLLLPTETQQFRVVAHFSDGKELDVTAHAKFQSNHEGLVTVQPGGLVRAGEVPGEAAVMASYQNEITVSRILVPRQQTIATYPALPENNFIDHLVLAKLRKLQVIPSALADDAEFYRRVSLDLIGTLPTAREARDFLNHGQPDRRSAIVESLLERPEYAEFWALHWSDLLRVDRSTLGPKRAYAYYRWIRDAFANNMPYDRFVREMIASEGPLSENPQGNFYKVVTKPGEVASTFSQVFLGVRIACAECHHHPFDRWSQQDYYGMTAYFTGVGIRSGAQGETISGEGAATAQNPRNGQSVLAFALGTATPKGPAFVGDARPALADWMTDRTNPWLARNLANRLWAHFMGRGLVEPVDDVRMTNPPSNPELLDALAQHLIDNHYNIRSLIRVIVNSRVYQLSSKPNATNERDESCYSRALLKRVGAEVLCDMISQVTGVNDTFSGAPRGTRAISLWDSKTRHYFLKVFGRPERLSACECERNAEPSVSQVLHLLNSPEINARLTQDGGLVARLTNQIPEDRSLVEELYLTYFTRLPTEKEQERALLHLQKHTDKRRQAAEDLAWSFLNSLEFLFNH